MNRLKFVLKNKGIKLTELSRELGLQYPSFNRMMNKPTLQFLKAIAEHTKITEIELQDAPNGYAHFYDESGQWQGIRKK